MKKEIPFLIKTKEYNSNYEDIFNSKENKSNNNRAKKK